MAKAFVQIFPYHLTEKPEWTFWLTQRIGNQEPNQNPINIPPYFDDISDCELIFNCRSQIFTFLASISTGIYIFDLDSATKHIHTHIHTHTHTLRWNQHEKKKRNQREPLFARQLQEERGRTQGARVLSVGRRQRQPGSGDGASWSGWFCEQITDNVSRMSAQCVSSALLRTCVHVLSSSVVSDSLRPRGRWLTKLLCPWNSLGKNTGVGCHFLLYGIFPLRDQILVTCIGRRIFYYGATREARCNGIISITIIYMSKPDNSILWDNAVKKYFSKLNLKCLPMTFESAYSQAVLDSYAI